MFAYLVLDVLSVVVWFILVGLGSLLGTVCFVFVCFALGVRLGVLLLIACGVVCCLCRVVGVCLGVFDVSCLTVGVYWYLAMLIVLFIDCRV